MGKIKKEIYDFFVNYLFVWLIEDHFFSSIRILKKRENAKIVVLGTPRHGNIGDHLIALSQEKFFKQEFSNYSFIQFSKDFVGKNALYIKKHITPQDIIVICGGGWMGDDYPQNENLIRKLILLFDNNRIIIMPQTVYYHNSIDAEGLKIYQKAENVLLFVRDNYSYEFCKRTFKDGLKIALEPDMALLYSDYTNIKKSEFNHSVGVCYRQDLERLADENDFKEKLIQILENDMIIKELNSCKKNRLIISSKRKKCVNAFMHEIADVDLLITDRLHPMIMAYLVGTPCIAFDNSTHKVSNVYNMWLSKSGYICLYNGTDDCLEFVKNNITDLKNIPINDCDFSGYHSEIALEIKKFIGEK